MQIDEVNHSLHAPNGTVIKFSKTEFKTLEILWNKRGHNVTREMLEGHVWGDAIVELEGSNVVDVYVGYVRRKLKKSGLDVIKTVRGVGYRLEV
jgi:DNA-binding response OmpR family regulator